MTSVLLVEDEADLLSLVAEALEHHGILVTEAASGENALEKLRTSGPFDVVVSDIAMPGGVSGIDVANHVLEDHSQIQVILTSGHPLSHFPPLPRNAKFLSKPYRVKQLIDLLRKRSM
jgi:two-component system cell cycle response regulator CpdR